MSKDKYPSIFLPQTEAIMFIILQIFFTTSTVLKIGEYSRIFPSLFGGIFGHVTCLNQSHRSENIWWIIYKYIYNPSNLFTRTRLVMWANIPLLKMGNIREYSPIFKPVRVAKKILRIIKTIVSIWSENMLGYLSADIICSEKWTVFRERRKTRKTVSFEEQIMSVDKYLSIFSRHVET